MIGIIDYGLGNVRAFVNVYKNLNIPAKIVGQAKDLENADKVILPGVGAFDQAMQMLRKSGMLPFLSEIVIDRHVPVLGVCVGMQILAGSSEEGDLAGLGWIDAEVKKFDLSTFRFSASVPHMGWNDVKAVKSNRLFQELENDARFYFLHSYYFQCHSSENMIAVTDYNGEFACAVNSGNIFGIQFHPEKSHQWGIKLLENFARL